MVTSKGEKIILNKIIGKYVYVYVGMAVCKLPKKFINQRAYPSNYSIPPWLVLMGSEVGIE